jgi:hypothetical protein
VKEFFKDHKVVVAIIVVLVVALAAAAVAWWFLFRDDGRPPEVTSAWPVATAERVVPKPTPPPVWPLTGMPAEEGDPIDRRPVAVKIENTSASRPQTGINSADVIYESVTEGGITRLHSIFHSDMEGVVGNIRSARLSDAKIVPQYDSLMVFSGASSSVSGKLRAAGVDDLSEDAGVTSIYFRSNNRPRPHNLYTELEKIHPEAEARGMSVAGAPRPFQYQRGSREATPQATVIDIPFSQANRAKWTYDSDAQVYLRETNGSVHKDAETGEQARATNVVVMWAKHTVASRDKAGSATYDIALVGEGRATVFVNGQKYDGTWEADASNPPRFVDESGQSIKLAPGSTWFQVVATDVNITFE